MEKVFGIVVAADESDAIGRCGETPWHIPEDMDIFRKITSSVRDPLKSNAIICGRKTRNNMPMMLLGRVVIVLSREDPLPAANVYRSKVMCAESCDVYQGSLQNALDYAWSRPEEIESVFVVGGAEVYAEAIKHPACSAIMLTRVFAKFTGCDKFFPSTDAIASLGFRRDVARQREERRSVRGIGYRLDVFRREMTPKESPI